MLATLIRLVGDFDLAEDSLQDAYEAAVEKWPIEGRPRNPVRWLISTARYKAIDRLRHDALADHDQERLELLAASEEEGPVPLDTLRLIFTCCHPALAPDVQVALTLKTICGLTTRRNSKGVPHTSGDARATTGPSEGEDQRRTHPLRGPRREPPDRAARAGARHESTSFSMRVIPLASAERSSARTCARRPSTWEGFWSSCFRGSSTRTGCSRSCSFTTPVVRRAPTRTVIWCCSRTKNSLALESRSDRGGRAAGRRSSAQETRGSIRSRSRNRRTPRTGADGSSDRLASDSRAIRRAARDPRHAGCGSEPGDRDRHGGRPGARAGGSSIRSTYRDITCSPPRARTCFGGSVGSRRPRGPTARPSPWSPMTRKGGFSSDGSRKWRRTEGASRTFPVKHALGAARAGHHRPREPGAL